jgi:hypothetical protein
VSGPNGAAKLLGMKSSTLFSRMTVLGLRPAPGLHYGARGLADEPCQRFRLRRARRVRRSAGSRAWRPPG